jgi:hypothetical protein
MGNEVEARTKCVRDHLRRPDHPDRQLTNAKVGSTVNRTAPRNLTSWRQLKIDQLGFIGRRP